MTDRRASDFVVGVTVLVVTAVTIGGTLWLKQADLGGRTRHLTVRSRDVGGVALGNPVVIRGVRAGRPKNGMNVDARPFALWSERKPLPRPSLSARGIARTA